MSNNSAKPHGYKNFLIGLSISLAVVLMAFEYRTINKGHMKFEPNEYADDGFIEYEPIRKIEKKKILSSPKTTVQVDINKPFEIEDDNKETKEVVFEEPDLGDIPDLLGEEEAPTNEPKIFIPLKSNEPVFPGGDSALYAFISENIRFPKTAHTSKSGAVMVYVSFEVDTTGEVSKIKVLNENVPYPYAAEAKRVIGLLPNWEPAYQGFRPVAVEDKMPIKFTLRN